VAREAEGVRRRARGSNLLSNLFAVAAVAFAILAAILYLRGSRIAAPVAPTAAQGGNQIVNVTEALEAQELTVELPPGLFIPRGALAVPGQGIEINGLPAFIFLYPNAQAATADAAGADPNQVVPDRLAGTPAPPGERRLARGSNVIVLLVGGDEETWQKVEAAVASLN
jgi:hypothetical protein